MLSAVKKSAIRLTTIVAFVALLAAPVLAIDDHLQLCEAVVTPTSSEYIEVFNPTPAAIDLTNYYLSDDEDYALLPGASGAGPAPSIGASDFIAQFPAGTSIPPGGVVVVAFSGAGFLTDFGFAADFEIFGDDAGTADMIPTDVGSTAGLTNSGENATLFFWDGASDLVGDVDMLNIGTPSSTNDIGDKTGLVVDGPDADTVASMYLIDVANMPQQAGDPGFGASTKRISAELGNEAAGGGNGITGDDETSEQITVTWDSPPFSAPDPGLCGVVPTPRVVINEFVPKGTEWVELYNAGDAGQDLTGWTLGDGVTSDALSGTLAAGGFLVVNVSSDLSNSGDLVELRDDANALVDFVAYGNVGGAPLAETGQSAARLADGVDSDDDARDWNLDTSPTQGAANDVAGVNLGGSLLINEIDVFPASGGDVVELFNPGGSAVDVTGWQLSDGDSLETLAGGSVPAGGFLALIEGVDFNTDFGSSDVAYLYDGSGVRVDQLGWTGEFEDGCFARLPDGAGPNDGYDWLSSDGGGLLVDQACTLGATNGALPPPELVINEIDYDQPTPPTSDSAEFVEIKNVGSAAVNLGSFELRFVNGNGGSVYDTIPLPSVSLAAGDYFVVCGDAANVFGCDLDDSPNTNFIQNGSPDAVALFQGSTLVDTVSYEGDTVAPYTEGSGSGLEDPGSGGAGGGNQNKGISRFPDGFDSDQNNVDLSTRCITPGAANSADASGCAAAGPPSLVVNEIDYDMPGSGDSAEFVEIKNVGTGAANLGGVELLLVNGNGASIYDTIALPSVTLGAGEYFVVCGDATNVANCDLDDNPNTNFIQNGAPDAVALRFSGSIIDTVSYEGDTAAPYTEGSGAGLVDSAASGNDFKGISRFPDGVDTAQNNIDLGFACITPGGANTDRSDDCSATGPLLEIWEIQGAGFSSPFDGSLANTTDNVVTCLSTDGFFMQTPTSRTDGDIATSDGIFVFTGGAPGVAVGDLVDVSGAVDEFFGFTEFAGGSTVTVTGSDPGQVPAAVVFDATVPSPDPTTPSCGLFDFECYEGMLVEITDGTVTGPNQRFGTDPVAEVHITAAPARTYREPGIEFPGTPPFPEWDGNPEVFELDPDKLGLANQVISAGSSFSATGVLGFEFGGYELWPNDLTVTPAPLPVPVRPRDPGEFTVGTLNLFRLFNDVDDPPDGDRDDDVRPTAEYLRRLTKFSAHIRDVLDSPDILAVQEVESLTVLEDLAAEIFADSAGAVDYSASLIEGNDIGTIDVGFLTRANIQVDSVSQIDPDATFVNPITLADDILHDRPPLLLEGSCQLEYGSFPISVIAVHNRSLSGIDGSQGLRVRKKRFLQAVSIAEEVAAQQVADPDVRLVVTGDFNAFEFTDGYVDAVGVITGDFVPGDNLVCDTENCAGLPDNDLADEVLGLDAGDRYSFIFRGTAQVLDHALASQGLAAEVSGAEFGRGNADAAVDLINDDGSVNVDNLTLRSSDHDGLVVYILKDEDADGVPNDLDVCAGTEIPETVPTSRLGTNRWALFDDDGEFDTTEPAGEGPGFAFDLGDTAGCSCEQIIEAQGLGNGHTKFGCSNGAMLNWVALVNP